MLIRTSGNDFNCGLRYSDVTPKAAYLGRRQFLGAGAAALGALALPNAASAAPLPNAAKTGPLHDLLKQAPVAASTVKGRNNFYEFGTGKDEPAKNAPKWKPDPVWPIRLEGAVKKPITLNLADIMKFGLEERIYRLRCVERWSLVVPWIGVPLAAVLKKVELTGSAKYVAFESFYDPKIMLSSRAAGVQFPYVEGLRLDEAMHPLTLLAVGMYGETLPNQDGAPIRLVVPWKYGFKSIKSITRIRFQEKVPPTTWNIFNAREYGFYSNVNPKRDHPRWSQEEELFLDGSGFIGEGKHVPTRLFNGYEAQVASLYAGMDLIKNF
jgi:sulfoxide reductase catalytic subunit YedY